jgi:hypothetical protein
VNQGDVSDENATWAKETLTAPMDLEKARSGSQIESPDTASRSSAGMKAVADQVVGRSSDKSSTLDGDVCV